jgi:hypothetical protein
VDDAVEAQAVFTHGGAGCVLQSPVAGHRAVTYPLRCGEILPLLLGIAQRFNGQRPASEAASSAPQSSDFTLAAFVAYLSSPEAAIGRASVALRVGPQASIVFKHEPGASRVDPLSLGWASWNLPAVSALGREFARQPRVALADAAAAVDPGTSPTCEGTLRQVVWLLALHDPGQKLASGLHIDARFSLKSWPDFGALSTPPAQRLRVAALVRQPMSLAELVQRPQGSTGEVIALLNACHWLGMLVQHLEPAAASAQVAEVRPPRRSMGLVQSIRSLLKRRGLGSLDE